MFKTEPQTTNLKQLSKQYRIPYHTLYNWVITGKLSLPKDLPLLAKLRRGDNGRWYLKEDE